MTSVHDDLKALVRTIPDFPKPGIQFRDITTLLLDSGGWRQRLTGRSTWSRQSRREDLRLAARWQ